MVVWGISALSHDAAITVMEGDNILFAAHAERYSRIKNDAYLNRDIVNEALTYGRPTKIYWYERPLLKKTRQIYAKQWSEVFDMNNPNVYLREEFSALRGVPIEYVDHHRAHAAAGFYTSPFQSATVIVVDGIGEWDTTSVWTGHKNTLTKTASIKYPNSLGLFYSAITQRVGLKPLEDEYILMGMAAYGDPVRARQLQNRLEADFFYEIELANPSAGALKKNLHRGIPDWYPDLRPAEFPSLALAAQNIIEEHLIALFRQGRLSNAPCNNGNVVFMGGVALNCVANAKLARICNNLWIMPNPGDAGSSLGAILASTNNRAIWNGPYLGTNIDKVFDIDGALEELLNGTGIIAIANGRAEFGPRALGNRSLIADPRGIQMKDAVNKIKNRQLFRPFAPVILEEYFHEAFDVDFRIANSPYMQFVGKCKYPELYPAICHADGTSRVQTVNAKQNPTLYELLRKFHAATDCPMLLNTSLNVKGEPLVNSLVDAERFSKLYNVRLF